jgi:alpha-ketoglutarate-dependent taurine dioxygenase
MRWLSPRALSASVAAGGWLLRPLALSCSRGHRTWPPAAPPTRCLDGAARAGPQQVSVGSVEVGRAGAKRLAQVRESEEGLEVQWHGAEDVSFFHYEWLHRNRPENIQSSGQNTQGAWVSVPQGPKSASLSDDGRILCVRWGPGTESASQFTSTFLHHHSLSHARLRDLAAARRTAAPSGGVSSVDYASIMQSEEGVRTWLEIILRDGICVIDGVPVEEGKVCQVAQRCGPVMHSVYGMHWDVKVESNPINIAYTNVGLDLHQDLPYYESPAGIQLLHCLRFDESIEGGATTFVDAFAAAETLRTTNPAAFDTLTQVPATFQKIHYDRAEPVHLVYRRPHIAVNHAGDVVSVFWSPAFEGPLLAAPERVQEYFFAYRTFANILEGRTREEGAGDGKTRVRLRPGQIVSFNNRRMVHGRYHPAPTPSPSFLPLPPLPFRSPRPSPSFALLRPLSPAILTLPSLTLGHHAHHTYQGSIFAGSQRRQAPAGVLSVR